MDILAHRLRTESGQMGNGRENLIALHNMGVHWVEADACLEPSGQIVIHHPGPFKPNIDAMSLQTLLGIISSLPKMHCCLDIKQSSAELIRRIVFLITELRLEEKIYITAFQRKIRIPAVVDLETDAQLLILAKKMNPRIRTHMIATWPWNLPELVNKYGLDAISFGWLLEPPMARYISKSLFRLNAMLRDLPGQIKEVQRHGAKVWCGICNDPEDVLYLAGLGVDGIMTDEPRVLMNMIKHQKIS